MYILRIVYLKNYVNIILRALWAGKVDDTSVIRLLQQILNKEQG